MENQLILKKHFERMGIYLSRQTMGNWLLDGAETIQEKR